MEDKVPEEIMNSQTNSLNASDENQGTHMAVISRSHGEWESLMAVAEKVKNALLPVEPSPDFVQGLHRNLLAMAGRNRPWTSTYARRGLLIGAAALGSALSLAGIIAYVVHARANAGAKTPVHG